MIKRTLAQSRPEISRVCGETGMSVTDARFLARMNKAQEELINEGDWPGVVDRWHINISGTTGELVLPYFLDRLMQVCVDDVPQSIRSPWFEFVQYGPGPLRDDRHRWSDAIADRGEVCSVTLIPETAGPWVIRCYATVDERVAGVTPLVNLAGTDPNGRFIRSLSGGSWINGVNLGIDITVPFTVTTQQFGDLKAVVKPQTNGYVRLTAWNGTTEVELSYYAPVETNPSYRKYFLPELWRQSDTDPARVVLARCRRRFVEVVEDDDELLISNLPALESMMIAQWKREAGNMTDYGAYKQTAVNLLALEAKSYLGKARIPAMTMTRGSALGVIPFVH